MSFCLKTQQQALNVVNVNVILNGLIVIENLY